MSFLGQRVKSGNKLKGFPLGSIQAKGWIYQQLRREADGMSGHLDELEPQMIGEPFITRHQAEGLEESVRAGWCGEISGNYWAGLVQLAFAIDDEKLIEKAGTWVEKVLANQEKDGYIGSYKTTDNRLEDYNPWGVCCAMRALEAWYEAKKDERVLEACHKGLLWFVENWKEHRTDYAAPSLMEEMMMFYQYTGDTRLMEWCEYFFEWLESNSVWPSTVSGELLDKLQYNSLHVGIGGTFKLPAIAWCFNGKEEYLKASENVVKRAMELSFQRTGAPSSNNEYFSPPGASAESEFCDFTFFNETFAWMAMVTGESQYGDYMEKLVFNASEGAKKKDGRAIAYMSSPNQIFATMNSSTYGNKASMEVYSPNYDVCCCPVMAVRILPEFVRRMIMTDNKGGIYFLCYGPVCLNMTTKNGAAVEVDEETTYPFDETIVFRFGLSQPEKFAVHFRIPAWCTDAEIFLNGEHQGKVQSGKYHTINHLWRDKDNVELRLPMKVGITEVNDSEFSDRKPYAVERGPLLYAWKIKEKWTAVAGHPVTPLPEDWHWYEAMPEEGYGNLFYPWTWALEEAIAKPTGIEGIKVVKREIGDALPWEESPISLKIPAVKAKYLYPRFPIRTAEAVKHISEVDGKIEDLELVPYGCTNLRISYFPVIRSRKQSK